jgi:hypothetical protein
MTTAQVSPPQYGLGSKTIPTTTLMLCQYIRKAEDEGMAKH